MEPTPNPNPQPTPAQAAKLRHPELDTQEPLSRVLHFWKHYGELLLAVLGLLAFFAVQSGIRTFIFRRAGGYDPGTLNAFVLSTLAFFYNGYIAWVAFKMSWPRLYRWLRSCAEQELLDTRIGFYDTKRPPAVGEATIALAYRVATFLVLCFKFTASALIYGFYFWLLHSFTLAALTMVPHG
jgi:hypothetical protein